MAFEQEEGKGSLFLNGYKTKENQPDYRGKCKINGKVHDISAWLKETRAGDDFLSISFSDEYIKPNTPATAKRLGGQSLADKQEEFDRMTGATSATSGLGMDDIPFMNPYKFMEYAV